MSKSNIKYIFILLGLSCVLFLLGNGMFSLTNPDEVFYAQTAKEMIRHNSWLTPYLFGAPQFEKPPFLYWLLRLAFFIFGISSFGARFFPAVFASLGVLATYFLGLLAFREEKKAFICALVLMSCGFYIGLAKTLFTDMIFSVFILFSLASFYWGYSRQSRKARGILLFSIFSALAVLTKGPLGFLIPSSVVIIFLLIRKDIKFLFCRYSLGGLIIFTALSLPWYIFMVKKYGSGFTREFFYNDHFRRLMEAEHIKNDKWYFYPSFIITGIFPWSLYLIAAPVYLFKQLRRGANPIYVFLVCWIAVVFLIFQPAHSKLASYIFPCFPALALATGDFIYNKRRQAKNNRVIFILSSVVPAMLFVAFLLRGYIEQYASPKSSCEYLLKNYKVDNVIISSKILVRGVKFYTDKEVAVIDIPGKNFFSPHPVPFLNSDEKVKDFLKKQVITYCVVKKSNLEDLERIVDKEFKISLLKKIGNTYLLEVQPNT